MTARRRSSDVAGDAGKSRGKLRNRHTHMFYLENKNQPTGGGINAGVGHIQYNLFIFGKRCISP